ncbi:uncharacterized protein LOC132296275 [Cornus florida]|uniref:uncharacterized protein LOC132296275 n=1 Tax=Cornus florida TaxID=4283 RepID=UPI00289CC881|nr:uncharacterized protein LOC132296275 [Cornus florida]
MVKILATYNDDVAKLVLENAPKNAKYTSPQIQKEILHVLARKVRSTIREDIGDAKFCILVDEVRDDYKREQMALVLRFVDRDGFLQERFFNIVHVKDTTSLTLKNAFSTVLSHYNLSVQDLQGQGYDGASNMRGAWNGLQALFLNDCPYAYYVHCLAHRLQLALVASSREVIHVYQFFSKLNFIINIIGASCKRNDELQSAQVAEIAHLIALDEIETGRGANQIGSLQRPGNTHWSSHFDSVCNLIRGLVETKKSDVYYLIDRLIRLVLTLPVSTATTEKAFSTMKNVKTKLSNKMEDEFLADYLSINIEKEIAGTFSSDSIIDDFCSLKHRRAQLL